MGLVSDDLDELTGTNDAAELAGVAPVTIRSWKAKGYLQPSGLDQHGRPMYRRIDVLRCEQKCRARKAKAALR